MGDTDGIRIYVLILKRMRVLFGRETGENTASQNEEVPIQTEGHFKVINFVLQNADSDFDPSIGTSCCFYSRSYSSLIPSRSSQSH